MNHAHIATGMPRVASFDSWLHHSSEGHTVSQDLALRADCLMQIRAELLGREGEPQALEDSVTALTHLIAQLSGDRDELIGKLLRMRREGAPPGQAPMPFDAVGFPVPDSPGTPESKRARLAQFSPEAAPLVTAKLRRLANLSAKLSTEPQPQKVDLGECGEFYDPAKIADALIELDGLKTLPALREVVMPHIDDDKVASAAYQQLSQCPQLNRINTPRQRTSTLIQEYSLGDEALCHLASLEGLVELPALRLSTMEGIEALTRFRQLESVKLYLPHASGRQIEKIVPLISRLKGASLLIDARVLEPSGMLALKQIPPGALDELHLFNLGPLARYDTPQFAAHMGLMCMGVGRHFNPMA